jgi:pimeloyl-ACP methyl ester carboxylesterase
MKLTVHGREAYAYTGGKPFDPALPCVVFIHGALNDHGVWNLLARWFAHHGRGVLAVDLPGHQRSAGPALATVESMAEWLLAVLDAAGVQQAALVGHSMGSLIALEAAGRAPERVTALGLVGTAYPMKVSQGLLDTSRDDPFAAIDQVVNFSHSTLAPKPAFPGPGMWLRGASRALMRQTLQAQGDDLLFHTDFSACNAYAGAEAAAARLRCPVRLVLGAADQMTRPAATAGLAKMTGATVHTVTAGHSLMAEAPDAVLEALRGVLS